jgi:flavin-dependent dehydrogenase
MDTNTYDAIVVGARCAGAPTAMLLARRGHRVLVLDRATFPSDTLSTHLIHPPGVARLRAWGLLDAVLATGCPPITRYSFDFGPVTVAGRPRAAHGLRVAYAPRRTVLDKLLVDAAADAGAEVREAFTVDEVLVEDGAVVGVRGHGRNGRRVTERARVVVGADGRYSSVARTVRPVEYRRHGRLAANYYTYWSGLPVAGLEIVVRTLRAWAAWPTNDGLTLVVIAWPYAEFDANRLDVEGNYLKALEQEPAFAARVGEARREDRFHGGVVANYFRRPFGPGWVLVGDAGYNKDPITAQGISDAFRDAELCAEALDAGFTGRLPLDEALRSYQEVRDAAVTAIYDFTLDLAALEPPPPEMQQLIGAMPGNQEAMDGFASVMAGTVSPADFFAPDSVGPILEAAGAAAR